jgi:hypothetical protein
VDVSQPKLLEGLKLGGTPAARPSGESKPPGTTMLTGITGELKMRLTQTELATVDARNAASQRLGDMYNENLVLAYLKAVPHVIDHLEDVVSLLDQASILYNGDQSRMLTVERVCAMPRVAALLRQRQSRPAAAAAAAAAVDDPVKVDAMDLSGATELEAEILNHLKAFGAAGTRELPDFHMGMCMDHFDGYVNLGHGETLGYSAFLTCAPPQQEATVHGTLLPT